MDEMTVEVSLDKDNLPVAVAWLKKPVYRQMPCHRQWTGFWLALRYGVFA
jgi:hypothetical protein